MADPFTLFFAGNGPNPDDNEVTSLLKIACLLYGGVGPVPYPGDNEVTSLNNIVAYLFWAQGGLALSGGGEADSYRIQGGAIQLYNPTTGMWNSLSVIGVAGQEQLVIGQPDATATQSFSPASSGGGAGDSYRLQDGQIQLFNPTTGLWNPLSVVGNPGSEQIVIGQGTN